jgi:hypothetical protein
MKRENELFGFLPDLVPKLEWDHGGIGPAHLAEPLIVGDGGDPEPFESITRGAS